MILLQLENYLDGKKRVTVVLQTGQVPFTIWRPVEVLVTTPPLTSLFLRHFTQYPLKSILLLLSLG